MKYEIFICNDEEHLLKMRNPHLIIDLDSIEDVLSVDRKELETKKGIPYLVADALSKQFKKDVYIRREGVKMGMYLLFRRRL